MDLLLKPVSHDQAAQFIASKPVLAREAFDQLVPDLRARAFTITGVESANAVQTVRDLVAQLPQGADWDTVKAHVADAISPWLDDGAEEAKHGQPETLSPSQKRAELLLRTHGFQAYSSAQYEVMQRQRDAFPFWQYLTAHDDRVRSEHAALDGLVLPADSAFWANHFPPWDWGCRCQVVPLQAEDVADIQAQDDGKAPEEQRVLDAGRLKELETTGQLTRAVPGSGGLPQRYDMRAPEQRGERYTFKPGTLKMDAEQLRPRYDAETWATFQKWAQRQQTDSGQTVWSWLTTPATPRPLVRRPPPTVARVTPKISTPPAATPGDAVRPTATPPPAGKVSAPPSTLSSQPSAPKRQSPVSAALDVRTAAPHKAQIASAIEAVDRVHDDGDLPSIPILGRSGNALGIYQFDQAGRAVQIGIGPYAEHWPALTTAHELGHFLDHQVLGVRGQFASVAAPELAEFRAAVVTSKSVQEMQRLGVGHQGEFLKPYELWARAYAQYIAKKSGDPLLLAQLAKIRAGKQSWRQWSDDDFAPIQAAIDNLFKKKGWIA